MHEKMIMVGPDKPSLVLRPLSLIKTCAGRGSGGMTRFLTDPRRNAGMHSIAIVNEPHATYEYCHLAKLQKQQEKWQASG